MLKTIIILSGIPCSGKSSWVDYFTFELKKNAVSVSRDRIRQTNLFAQPYQHTRTNEELVTEIFDRKLKAFLKAPTIEYIILDNTYCKEKYIDEIIKKYNDAFFSVKIKFFDCPLWKAWLRNIGRRVKTGDSFKWIPWRILVAMNKNYKNIDKSKYKTYICK